MKLIYNSYCSSILPINELFKGIKRLTINFTGKTSNKKCMVIKEYLPPLENIQLTIIIDDHFFGDKDECFELDPKIFKGAIIK